MKHALRAAAAAFLSIAAAASSAQSAPDANADRGRFQVAFDAGPVRMNSGEKWYPFAVQLTAGWRGSRYWAVEAFLVQPFIVNAACTSACDSSFGQAYGARAVGYVPVAGRWDLMGDIGLATTTQYLHGSSGPSRQLADGVVGAGLMWRGSEHHSLGLAVNWFTRSQTPMVGVRSEWHF